MNVMPRVLCSSSRSACISKRSFSSSAPSGSSSNRMEGWVYFFFQAEDGIRDGHVTGVQTCALPIWDLLEVDGEALVEPDGRVREQPVEVLVEALVADGVQHLVAAREVPDEQLLQDARSEERRVGKECRARRAPSQVSEADILE